MLEIQNSGTLHFNNNDKAPEEKKKKPDLFSSSESNICGCSM